MNLSLSLGGTIRGDPVLDGWRVVGSVVNVFPSDSLFPLLSAVVPVMLKSTTVGGRKQSL